MGRKPYIIIYNDSKLSQKIKVLKTSKAIIKYSNENLSKNELLIHPHY